MSGGSSANNSWTILTPQETVAETLRPLAEGTEHHEESLTSAAGSGENQPASCAESAERLPVDGHLVSEEITAELSGDTSTEQHTDASVPTSSEVSDSAVAGKDALSQSEGLPEGTTLSGPDPDSFSDSYSHIIPSPDEPSASLLSTETLGGVEFTQEEEGPTQEGTHHLLNREELQQRGEESDLFPKTTDLWKQADSLVDSEVEEGRTEKTGEEAEPELRRRRSLLAVLERIGRTDEEEEGEEEFQLPQREVDSGLSVNKCILGAVILLGIGTIFFSESDYGTMELKDAQAPGKQELLNPEVPPVPVDTDSSELLNKLAEGKPQISVLQARLQEHNEATVQAEEGAQEQLQWEEMKKENTATEAAQAAVQRVTSPPSGQPENSMQDSAGSTETQSKKPRDDQQEKGKYVKKDTIDIDERKERNKSEWKEGEKRERKDGGKTEWKQGNHEQGKFDKENDKDGKQKRHGDETIKLKEKEWKKEKTSRGDEGKPWKDKEGNKEWIEKSERKERKEEKDWKKGNHENLKDGKQWRSKEEKKDWKVGKDHGGKHRGKEEEKEWKVGKDHGGKHKGKEEWKEEKEWKVGKDHGGKHKGKEEWKEEKEWKVGKDHGGKHKGKEEWKEEKEWKKGKDGFEESGKEKWGKKDLKKKELKKNDGDWKSKNGKDRSKEVKGERKQWEENINHGKERKGKNERKQWNAKERKSKNGKDDEEWRKKDERKPWEKDESWKKDKKPNGDWKKDRSSSQSHKDEHKRKVDHGHREEQMWGDAKLPHTHSRPSQEQPEYWDQQRHRLQHNSKPPQQCSSVETCAHTEELLPVPFPEFEVVLQTYLAKAEEAGVEESKREELRKLAAEFFRDGVFVHDQTSFKEFVKDLGDILEDMVEGDDEAEEEDSDKEDEMEEFEREVMKKFSVPGAVEKEWRKESGRGRG